MSLTEDSLRLNLTRLFTSVGRHPFDAIDWERRDARLIDHRTGVASFEQLGIEVPSSWSVNATNIVAQKYFRGTLGTTGREESVRQLIGRVVDTITTWGHDGGYFADHEQGEIFRDELLSILVMQRAAFNSPVWFNIGVDGVPNQSSACFILSVEDSMDSILEWVREEGVIFKGGSGAGVNLSKIRASTEHLGGGGTPSGPVSFMRGADSSAGTIKSGGKTRRAAKMVILDVDHPDIEEFIWCKAKEERKARVLRAAGFDMDLDGADAVSIQYQNANNSVRVPDGFMEAVLADGEWDLTARTSGEVLATVRAADVMDAIAGAAWDCADPGMQFDTTINQWHTTPASGRINGSNPCFPGSARVHTDKGLVRFDELFMRVSAGEEFNVWTHDVTDPLRPDDHVVLTAPEAFMITGRNPIVRLRFSNGGELRCTPGHRIFTTNRGFVPANELNSDDFVRLADLPTPAPRADRALPAVIDGPDGHLIRTTWTPELAHLVGRIAGGATFDGSTMTMVYRPHEVMAGVCGRHSAALEELSGIVPKVIDRDDGSAEIRLVDGAVLRWLIALGASLGAEDARVVPAACFELPDDLAVEALGAMLGALGYGRNDVMAAESRSPALLRGIQRMLSAVGVMSSIAMMKPSGGLRTLTIEVAHAERFRPIATAAGVATCGAPSQAHPAIVVATLLERTDEGVELTYNLTEPRNHSYLVDGIVVRNCSEYMHVDDSACNLASINLLSFLGDDGVFDVAAYEHTISMVFLAQEILISQSDYPTEAIGRNARAFRQLGLGFTNLGALFMALGLAYDSDGARAWAGALTAIMTGRAYATSAAVASRMGPFDAFESNAQSTLGVLDRHRAELVRINPELLPESVNTAAERSWADACESASVWGVRNAQATVVAPTGTISFLLDCDTTGIEPDLGLVKSKKLVGGGTMTIVNQTVPRALARLGYSPSQSTDITAHILEHRTLRGVPHLRPEHEAVFACSIGENVIAPMGHLKMMAAVQPFISGAISKTVNLPESTSVDQVRDVYITAWKLGLKAVALYRDNCKVGQPMTVSTSAHAKANADVTTGVTSPQILAGGPPPQQAGAVPEALPAPIRERLPRSRRSRTLEFRVADCKGFVTVGEYDDGRPGELFIRVSKQGSTLAGIMDAFAIAVSHGLQYGVPLRAYIDAYVGMRFEPAGMTDDPELRIATSLMDYLFRRLAVEYLDPAERADLGIHTVSERIQPTLPGVEETTVESHQGLDIAVDRPSSPLSSPAAPSSSPITVPVDSPHRADPDAPLCMNCGIRMQRAGSCYACGECGSTSGCS